MKKQVIELTRDDIVWPFSNQPPYVLTGQGRWGGSIHHIDPFPAYSHDKGLVEEMVDRVTERVPIEGDLAIYILPAETVVRTNGWTQSDFERHYGDDGKENEPARFQPSIGLDGKRIPIHPAMTRYLVGHEYGHVIATWLAYKANLHNYDSRLIEAEYAELRGLEAQKASAGVRWHLDHGEVFANDFRILIANVEKEFWPHPGIEPPKGHLATKLMHWWDEKLERTSRFA